ncbi:hypothetical protein M0655_04340 [Gordonia amicalis]|nr:TRAM domain-containing protein [Gordonia amicalis]UPW14837.1 hypothetical protein M0655_04340 [Gordonia amicalis]
MTPSPPARRVEVAVDRPANGGEAVGRADGRVLFVRGAIPGERVVAEITDDRHDSYWRAEAVEILDPSPHRIPVACPAAAGGAGCCDLGHIEPGHARDLKQAVLLDVLSRVGHLDEATIADTDLATRGVDRLPGADTGWRIRTRLAVDGRGRAGQRAFRGSAVIHDVCVQPAAGMVDDLASRRFTPHAELAVVLDADGTRHITELAPIAEVRHGDPPPARSAEPSAPFPTPRTGRRRGRRVRGAPRRRPLVEHPGDRILAGAPRRAADLRGHGGRFRR